MTSKMDYHDAAVELDPRVYEVEQALGEHFKDSSRRLHHSFGCAQTAVLLASIYGVDASEAAIAGLLHDWDKNLEPETLRAYAVASGLSGLSQSEIASGFFDSVLHSFTAAVSVKEAFSWLSPQVCTAIAKHTVGSEEMSELDAVLYIADAIEPSRTASYEPVDFELATDHRNELEELRASVGTISLTQLMFATYRYNVKWIIETRRPLYPKSAMIYNALLGGGNG